MARSTVVRHETVVGLFAVVAGVLLAAGLVVKGAKTGFGARTVVFTADAGHDLKNGATVKMHGIEVGEVAAVELSKENTVEVKLRVFPQFRDNVREDAT